MRVPHLKTSQSRLHSRARPYVCQIDAILPKQGKKRDTSRGGKVGADEQDRWRRAENEKNIAKLGVRTLIPTHGDTNVERTTVGYVVGHIYTCVTFTRMYTQVVFTRIHTCFMFVHTYKRSHEHFGLTHGRYRHTLALFRKSDNENTLRYTLVPEDIPIRKVYQKVQQLQLAGGGNPKLAVSDGAGRSLLVDSPSDRHRSVLVDRGNEKEERIP